MEVFQEFEALGQSRENGELSVEGVLPEEEVEDGRVVDPAGLPVRVRHGDLVQIWKQRAVFYRRLGASLRLRRAWAPTELIPTLSRLYIGVNLKKLSSGVGVRILEIYVK
jgi:hypothetical protein